MVTPRLTRTFGVLNHFFNMLAYDPPGGTPAVLLLERLGRARGRTMFDLQDAHGPVRREHRARDLQQLQRARAGGAREPAARRAWPRS